MILNLDYELVFIESSKLLNFSLDSFVKNLREIDFKNLSR